MNGRGKTTRLGFLVVAVASLGVSPGTAAANPTPTVSLFHGLGPALSTLLALGMEGAVVAGILAFRSLYFRKTFIGYMVSNVAIFLLLFSPVLALGKVPVILLELAVVAIDAAVIKLMARVEALQTDSFKHLSWRAAAVVAAAGNLVSYLLGVAVLYVPRRPEFP